MPIIMVMTALCNISFVQIIAQITEFATDLREFVLVTKDIMEMTALCNTYSALIIALITEFAIV
jgi:hypothetical protein